MIMKQTSLLKTMLLLCALIVGGSAWADTTIYSWDGTGSTTTANETGGTAEAKGGNSNIVVGASQKGNWCLKMNKGFSNTYYIEITLDEALKTGDKVTIGAFRTTSTTAVLGVDFGTTATQTLKTDTDVLESNGTPTDFEITVPAAANGGTKIRLYRNSGSTGMWVSKVVVTTASSGSGETATWTVNPATATVTAGQSTTLQLTTNYDGTLNFLSNDEAVATVSYNSSTKVITVNGIATGTTSISVTGDATSTYNAINKAIAVTVNHAELTSNVTDVMSGFGYSYFGLSPKGTGSDDYAQPDVTSTDKTDAYGVSISIAKAESQTLPRYDAGYIRFYKDNTLTVTAPAGSYITKIVFTEPASGAQWNGTMYVANGDYLNSEKTWYADVTGYTSVVITGKEGTNRFAGLKVYLNTSSVPVSISTAGLATFASDVALDFSGVTGVEAYIAKESAGDITLTKVNKVPAGTGVLLRSTVGAVSKDVPVAATADDVTGNIFVRGTGAAVATDAGAGKTNYVLGKKSGVVGFYKANGAVVNTDKAYLQTTIAAARIDFNFDNEEATAIETVKAQNAENGEFFDLQGRKVAQPTKGLYIVNGKKVIIK
jgi:hypothetical protein